MKRSTVIGHLVEVAEVSSDRLRLRDTTIGWPLEELWVTGELLEPGSFPTRKGQLHDDSRRASNPTSPHAKGELTSRSGHQQPSVKHLSNGRV